MGTVMMSVSATDEDGGENGRVRYELAEWNTIVDADGSLITVDEKSGEITLNGVLDREEAESHRSVFSHSLVRYIKELLSLHSSIADK